MRETPDICTLCGAPLKDRDVFVVGRRKSAVHQACEACLNLLEEGLALSVFLSGPVIKRQPWMPDKLSVNTEPSPQMKADRAWFAANPTRSHHVRRAADGEDTSGAIPDAWTVVRQIEPGQRFKVLFGLSGELGDPPDEEEIGHALFDLVMEARKAGREGVIPLSEIGTRIRAMSGGGRA